MGTYMDNLEEYLNETIHKIDKKDRFKAWEKLYKFLTKKENDDVIRVLERKKKIDDVVLSVSIYIFLILGIVLGYVISSFLFMRAIS